MSDEQGPTQTFYSVQGLRAIAALLVVMFHYNQNFINVAKLHHGAVVWVLTLGHLKAFGAIGVPIFFAISGFVIGIQQFSPGAIGAYVFMARRIARIVPLYWAVTLLLFAFGVYAQAALGWSGSAFTWQQLLASLGFSTRVAALLPVIGPGWTLEFEMLFYLLFAITTVSGILRSKLTGELCIVAVFVVLNVARSCFGGAVLEFFGNPRVFEFCGGVLISSTFRNPAVAKFSFLYLTLGLCIAAFSASSFAGSPAEIQTLWGVSGFFLVLGLVTEETKGRVHLGGRWLQVLGGASYAIYLLHMPIDYVIARYVFWDWSWHLLLDPHLALLLLMLLPVALGIAVHYGFERPVNRRVASLLIGKRHGAVPTSAAA